MKVIPVDEFIEKSLRLPVIDVRSPVEYRQGHIPGAVSIPLFDNTERALVGTLYKQEGRQKALLKGLELAGGKAGAIVESVLNLNTPEILIHCWRGGMRSSSVASLLDVFGIRTFVLEKGYKAFRNWATNIFNLDKQILVLGGKTGAGKTQVLSALKRLGQQIIDLEALAAHKGSAFGDLGENSPPTQEQFENALSYQWFCSPDEQFLWLEDESRTIGRKVIPELLWQRMRRSTVIFLDVPQDIRLRNLVEVYGKYPTDVIRLSYDKIKKRLGGLRYRQALHAIDAGNTHEAAAIALEYYDKAYDYGLGKRDNDTVIKLEIRSSNPDEIAGWLIETVANFASEWK